MKKQTVFIFISFILLVLLSTYFFLIKNDNKTKILIKGKEYSLTGNTLNLDSKGLLGDEVGNITQKISDNKFLETLYLGGNDIGEKGLKYLADLQNPSFKVIDLSNNKVLNNGVSYFLNKSVIKTIDLSGNGLTDKVFSGILINEKISYLTVNRNQITDIGFKDILKNKNLEYLSIEQNILTDKSIDYLAKSFENKKLKYLRLKGNNFSKDGIKKLDELKNKKVFETLEY